MSTGHHALHMNRFLILRSHPGMTLIGKVRSCLYLTIPVSTVPTAVSRFQLANEWLKRYTLSPMHQAMRLGRRKGVAQI